MLGVPPTLPLAHSPHPLSRCHRQFYTRQLLESLPNEIRKRGGRGGGVW